MEVSSLSLSLSGSIMAIWPKEAAMQKALEELTEPTLLTQAVSFTVRHCNIDEILIHLLRCFLLQQTMGLPTLRMCVHVTARSLVVGACCPAPVRDKGRYVLSWSPEHCSAKFFERSKSAG